MENLRIASDARDDSVPNGKNLELSFFCTVERLPKSGPVTLLMASQRIATTEAANTNLRCEPCAVVFVDTDFPFRSLAERDYPKLAALSPQLERSF